VFPRACPNRAGLGQAAAGGSRRGGGFEVSFGAVRNPLA
jgi:hypothetical protein